MEDTENEKDIRNDGSGNSGCSLHRNFRPGRVCGSGRGQLPLPPAWMPDYRRDDIDQPETQV